MSRDFYIGGESMVLVKGPAGSPIAALTELGLATDEIRVSPRYIHEDLIVNAWGTQTPVEVQSFPGECMVSMNLIHVDVAVLRVCMALSAGGAATDGAVGRAGQRMGNNLPRFATGNFYIGLNITAPVGGLPYRFYYAYMPMNPVVHPLGTQKSIFACTWRAIPFSNDPYGGGTAQPAGTYGFGSLNAVIYDHTLDT